MMIAAIFVLFILYTLACVVDGQDVKPIWKRWLSYPRLYQEAQDEITCLRNQLMTKPIPVEHIPFISERVESNIYITESEVFERMKRDDMIRKYGWESGETPCNLDLCIVDNTKRSMQEVFNQIVDKGLIDVCIDRESYYPAIIIRSSIVVGKRK